MSKTIDAAGLRSLTAAIALAFTAAALACAPSLSAQALPTLANTPVQPAPVELAAIVPPSPDLAPAASTTPAVSTASDDPTTLPEAPSATLAAATAAADTSTSSSVNPADAPALNLFDQGPGPTTYPRQASPTDITVAPGQVAPTQTVRDKMIGSVKDSISPFTLIGEVISGGYSHLTNGSPNYGTDGDAFAQRVGAAFARGTSQNIFYEGVMASVLHEDPRYYKLGPGQPFFKRVAYSITRPLITRTDGGRSTPNLALFAGYFGAAALTKTYYPSINQGFNQTLQTFGGSLGGAAIGYAATEFLDDAFLLLHLKKTN